MRDVELRAVGAPQRLWDVANIEAHVSATLKAWLDSKPAWLNPEQKLRALSFLWSECWRLSGLVKDGDPRDAATPEEAESMLRFVWEVRGFFAPRGPLEPIQPFRLTQFNEQLAADLLLEGLVEQGRPLLFARVVKARPNGAYDPEVGLSFSTYSRRILTLRIADWYRGDEEFGDTRYGNGERPESLEALAERERRRGSRDRDESFIDRHGPGAHLDFVDDLNRHAYDDPFEEVLSNVAVGR